MENIYKSASKIVFILMAVAACILTFIGILTGAEFLILANGAFAFYYSNKGNSDQEYLGK